MNTYRTLLYNITCPSNSCFEDCPLVEPRVFQDSVVWSPLWAVVSIIFTVDELDKAIGGVGRVVSLCVLSESTAWRISDVRGLPAQVPSVSETREGDEEYGEAQHIEHHLGWEDGDKKRRCKKLEILYKTGAETTL